MTSTCDVLVALTPAMTPAAGREVAGLLRAAAHAGYTTGILTLDPSLPLPPELNEPVSLGDATVFPPDGHIETRGLLVWFDTALPHLAWPTVETERIGVLIPEGFDSQELTELRQLRSTLERVAAGNVEAFKTRPSQGAGNSEENVWWPVIDVDGLVVDRTRRVGPRPVIGRHSAQEWPARHEELLKAYPASGGFHVRIQGGAGTARDVLGDVPGNWTAYADRALPLRRFLAGVDVAAHLDGRGNEGALLLPVLESLASGAPVITERALEPHLGDACLYLEPGEVRETVSRLHRDPAAYREHADRALTTAYERFGVHVGAARLMDWMGDTSHDVQGPASPPTPVMRNRVLFVSSNGAGVGHLMRLMSMARRATRTEPLFFTFSQAVGVVHSNGFVAEYLNSRPYSDMPSSRWHALVRERVLELVDRYEPLAVVFDGTHPYRGLLDARRDHPDVRYVWSRRGMWRTDVDTTALAYSDEFDLIVEPGEFAEASDVGPTSTLRHQVTKVGPVLYLEEDELLPREEARVELGLDPEEPAVLVQLGAGNINDTSSTLGAIVERLTREHLQVCVTKSVISEGAPRHLEQVHSVSVYPLARYFQAFDFAVAASGYNTFHELISFAVPTIFVPNLETHADDQLARARFAHDVGAGICLPDVHPESLDEAVRRMLDADQREDMRAACRAGSTPNGAADAIAAIEALVSPPSPATQQQPEASTDDSMEEGPQTGQPPDEELGGVLLRVRRTLGTARRWVVEFARAESVRAVVRYPFRLLPRPAQASIRRVLRGWEHRSEGGAGPRTRKPVPVGLGRHVPEPEVSEDDDEPAPVVAIVLERNDPEAIAAVVAHQLARTSFRPLFVTTDDDFGLFREHGYQFEYILPRSLFDQLAQPEPWDRYRRDRLTLIMRSYGVSTLLELEPDQSRRERNDLLSLLP